MRRCAVVTRAEDIGVVISPKCVCVWPPKDATTTHTYTTTLAQSALECAKANDASLEEALGRVGSKKVLVLGSGGREHALTLKLSASPQVAAVYVAPGNGGTRTTTSAVVENVPGINIKDPSAVVEVAQGLGVDMVVVGPEDPLSVGVADALAACDILCFGPKQGAAMLETSKAFSKDFFKRNSIPTAEYATFTDHQAARSYIEGVDHRVVIKCSGLAAGKGVLMPGSKEEALQAVDMIMWDHKFGSAGDEVVVEEFLEGEEVSVLAFTDGKTVCVMPPAQDHKRALEGDEGLNTGGMGAYAPAPVLTEKLRAETSAIIQRTVDAMAKEGNPYCGVLYAGFMLTKSAGPMVLEYNCRFGDPETQVLLPLLRSDLYQVMDACVRGTLGAMDVEWYGDTFAATVVAAAPGYPEAYAKGLPLSGLEPSCDTEDTAVYHAGTKVLPGADGEGEGEVSLVTSGGRVLAVTGVGGSLPEALDAAYRRMARIHFDGMHFRRDIGWRALTAPLRVGILGSTRGTDLQAIIDAVEGGALAGVEVSIVVSNKADAPILARAARHGIPHVHLSAKGLSREQFDAKVSAELRDHGVHVVLLIGYMRILSPFFCAKWENRCLNVHPSLLPDFPGGMDVDVHRQVLGAGRAETGCTIHWVTEEIDGGPIVVQKKCAVDPGDTPETLKAKVQLLEGKAFIESLVRFRDGDIGADSSWRQPRGRTSAITYRDAGVDIAAGNTLVEKIKPACKATRRPGCDADLGGFGGLFDLAASGYDANDTLLVGATDGVGTKLRVAQATGIHEHVGVDLVAMCVNDLIVQGAEPLFFLDYFATGHLEVDLAASVVSGIAQGCCLANCGLIGGETAEMPSMYADGDYDLGGFAVGAVRKGGLLPRMDEIAASDVVLGLPSSGVHSNGFSLVRKVVDKVGLSYDAPAPFDASRTLGEALVAPTRIYVAELMPVIRAGLVKALAHITGGGLTENIPRVLPAHLGVEIDTARAEWRLPAVFQWLQDNASLPKDEMLRTFNCGVGMVLVVDAARAAEVVGMLSSGDGSDGAFTLGTVVAWEGQQDGGDVPQVHVVGDLVR